VVVTGGPGAGKTAFLELVRHSLCRHVKVLPEAAGIVFGGGFPRGTGLGLRQAAQRAIFYVQRELERSAEDDDAAIVVCDRGTVDGIAYWPDGCDMWQSLGTTHAEQLARYDTVIHLRTPGESGGYNHRNPLRLETAADAAIIDERLIVAWDGHPHRFIIPAAPDFLSKATQALAQLRQDLPACCRQAGLPAAVMPAP
jgi:predicted ATPase